MALDFPASPALHDTYSASTGAAWVWDGAKWVAASGGGGAGGSYTLPGRHAD